MHKYQFKVLEATTLLPFLFANIKKESKNTIKNFLKYKMVHVNGKPITQFNHPLLVDDEVFICEVLLKDIKVQQSFRLPFEIIYEQNELIAINKPYGMLSIDEDEKEEKTAYNYLKTYLQMTDKDCPLYILHRLDKDTSGVLVFTKNFQLKEAMQNAWSEVVSKREYVAVVSGVMTKKQGQLVNYLNEGKNTMVRISPDKTGELALTNYKVVKENKMYSLLNVEIMTGKRNQIRVQLNKINHPIIGDKKYGNGDNPIHRLGLHASLLELTHPIQKEKITIKAEVPFIFHALFKRKY